MEALCSNNFLLLGLFHFLLFLVCFPPAGNAEFQRFELPLKRDGSMNFLVIGDWGRRGDYNQSEVAVQMGKVGEKLNISFVVSTGDNFYDNGLVSDVDPEFEESFTKIYNAPSLQKPWYSVLGNHDYRGNAEAQLSLTLRKIDRRWLCLRSFIVNSELVEIFFVDTTPFVTAYFTDAEGHTYDWRGVRSRRQYVRGILKDLEPALKTSTATWKIVVGHHAIRSISHHGDTSELVEKLLPLLRAYNVDFYMNGHDHCLQHIQDTDGGIRFLTSGAGSKAWRGDIRPRNENVNYFYDGQGFMSVELTPDSARIVFYDVFGEVLHEWTTSKRPYAAA